MITEKELNEIRRELTDCKNPLFIFHDDADGLSSFLLLYKFAKKGNWILYKKNVPEIDSSLLPTIKKYNPSKIFVLDIAMITQEFIDKANVPIIWIDHHQPLERKNVKYFNPRIENKNDSRPATYWCYKVAGGQEWIAMLGCLGDYYLPEFFEDFIKKHPDLAYKTEVVDEIIFNTPIGKLVTIVSFNLTGNQKEARRFVELFLKIKNPNEILKKETEEGRLIYAKYENVKKEYDEEIKRALKQTSDDVLVYKYKEKKHSISGTISNELRYKTNAKIIIVAKEKENEFRCNIRSREINILPIIEKALEGIEGRGGGHEKAAGAVVAKKDFERFVERIRELI